MLSGLSLAFRSLRDHPSRAILTTFGIVLGVAVILAINITNTATLDSINALFTESSGRANLVVTNAAGNEQGFDENIRMRLAGVPGITYAIPSVHVQSALASETAVALNINYFGPVEGGLVLYGIDPAFDREAREYKLVEGQFLSSSLDRYDLVLVQDYAKAHQITVGKDIELLTPSGVQRLRVVGLLSKQGAGLLNNGAFGILPLRTAQKLFERGSEVDQIDIVAQPEATSGAALDRLQTTARSTLGDAYSVVYPATQGRRVTRMLDTYRVGLDFFSMIGIFVGAFLIYNAFSMTVVERTREIGMLRTIGMTQGQVIGQILVQAAILGLVGAVIGVGLGVLLSKGMIRVSELLFAQELRQVQIPLDSVLLAISIGIFVTLLAALLPALQASRISPLEALRVRGHVQAGWLMRRGWVIGATLLVPSLLVLYGSLDSIFATYQLAIWAVFTLFLGATLMIPIVVRPLEILLRPLLGRVYGREGQLGTRNTRRAKSRTALTVGALMVGLAMVLAVQGMTNAFMYDLHAWVDVFIGGDLYVHSSVPLRADFERRLKAVPGVSAVAPVRFFHLQWSRPNGRNDRLVFMAVDPASYRKVSSFIFAANQGDPDLLLDRLARGDAVFISSAIAEMNGLRQGDKIHLDTDRGKREFHIAGVVTDYNNHGLVIHGTWRDMDRYFGYDDASGYLLRVQPGIASEEVRGRIEKLYGESRHVTVDSNTALKARLFQMLDEMFRLFDVLAWIAMIVAALGVVNTMTMSVLERIQEIGMLRALGMTRLQVSKMIMAEALLLGLIGAAFGLTFGYFLSRVLIMAVNGLNGYDLAFRMPPDAILGCLLIGLGVSQVAAIWPARRAVGVHIIETIHFE